MTPAEAAALGLGSVPGLDNHIRPYRNGRDLAARPRGVMVIDLFPLTETQVRDRFPAVYQWVSDRVKPEREQNREEFRRKYWWWFGRRHTDLRQFLLGLPRYIATVETAKHRWFQFLDAAVRPDNMLVNIGLDDAYVLGVLSSRLHVAWALAAGGTLEDRPRYNKTRCFDTFPFPDPPEDARARIRDLGERLDAHRKQVLDEHKHLTMTGLYNVLEKARAGTDFTDADKDVYAAGLVAVLRGLHDDLDAAVSEAYGWPADLAEADLLQRLVDLNRDRAAEEADGQIRWLRPDFQAPKDTAAAKTEKQLEAALALPDQAAGKPRFPAKLPDQAAALRAMLEKIDRALTPPEVARMFSQGKRAEKRVADVLHTFAVLGQAEKVGDGYVLLE